MLMHPLTESPLSHDADDDHKAFVFGIYVAVIITLAIVELVLHYHFK